MRHSAPSTDAKPTPATTDAPVLVGEGGIAPATPCARDPFRALDDLMVVVEALCPEWPARDIFRGNRFLL